MLRRHFLGLVVGVVVFSFTGKAQADIESQLLKKFQNQNQAAADQLKKEAARLLDQAQSPGHDPKRDLEPLQKILDKLQNDTALPTSERTFLIRKVQDRLRESRTQAEKKRQENLAAQIAAAQAVRESWAKAGVEAVPKYFPSYSKPTSPIDSSLRVKQGFFAINTPGGVLVPDGGTRILGGYSYMAEARNEFGVPILGKIPYLSPLFRNTSYGRVSGGSYLAISVRIIDWAEEEAKFLERNR